MIGLEAAKVNAELTLQAFKQGAATQTDAERAKLDVASAESLVDIRKCELNEVEVKLKFASKRLEEAKAAPAARPGVRPAPQPVPVDPDGPAIAEIKARLAAAEAAVAASQAKIEQSQAQEALARAELERLLRLAERGIVAPREVEAAKLKSEEARAEVAAAQAALKAAELQLAEAKSRLKGKPSK
jgi:hypothetical protein